MPSETLLTMGSFAPSVTPFAISSRTPLAFGGAVLVAAAQIAFRLFDVASELGRTVARSLGLPPATRTVSSPAITPSMSVLARR